MSIRHSLHRAPVLALLAILALGGFVGFAAAQAGTSLPVSRITQPVDDSDLVPLAGQTHPLAIAKYDRGAVPDTFPMNHMFLQLRRSPQQEKALQNLLNQLQDPHSPNYHKWLTARQIASFGPAQEDIDSVVQWLTSHGLQVNAIHQSRLTIDVSGTAGQVREAFHTEIHKYIVHGEQHIANASDPMIPASLGRVMVGMVSLHDFMPKPMMIKPKKDFTFTCTGCPDGFDGAVFFDEAPADFATIYNVSPLYKAKKPITGKGQTVYVIESSNINPADVKSFRTAFGLSSFAGKFSQVHPGTGCANPGINDEEGEAAVDAEWAGAVAPDANVVLASCASTDTNFGGFIAVQNLLDSAHPPAIMSLSFSECEAALGPSGNAFFADLWLQAALEGTSVFVSSGDGAAAGCDDFDTATFATGGIAANGIASTPFNVATGGTDFQDTALNANGTYWKATNSATGLSAKSYIPEIPWNDSCAGSIAFTFIGYSSGIDFCNSSIGMGFLNIVGGSGAPSFVYSKPFWQTAIPGNPNDGKRDLPDVSLYASNGFWSHAILLCMSDAKQGGAPCNYTNPTDTLFNSAGGTSFTAPQFASIQALINQKAGVPQGNPDMVYYALARAQYSNPSQLAACNSAKGKGVSNSCVFYDVTLGDNDVPCFGPVNCYAPISGAYGVLSTSDSTLKVAYPATKGWDFATGIGTVNVTNLVNSWP